MSHRTFFVFAYGALIIGGLLCTLAFLYKAILRALLQLKAPLALMWANVCGGEDREKTFPSAYHTAALIGIVLAGAALRTVKLSQSFYCDEITLFTIFFKAIRSPWFYVSGLGDHKLNTILSYGMMRLFGAHEAVLRIPALLFGLATFPLIWWFGKTFLSRKEGLLAALLLAFSSTHVLFSNQARGYSAFVFFHLASSFLFLKLLLSPSQQGTKKYYFLLALTTALGMYSHFFYIIPTALQLLMLSVLFLDIRILKKSHRQINPASLGYLLASILGGVILSLFLYGPALIEAIREYFTHYIKETNAPLTLLGILSFISSPSFRPCAAAFLTLFIIGVLHLRNTRGAVVALYFLVIVAIPLSGAAITGIHLSDRYFAFILPLFMVGAIHGCAVISRMATRNYRLPLLTLLISILILFQLPTLVQYYCMPAMEDLRGCGRFIDAVAAKKSIIFGIGTGTIDLPFYMHKHTIITQFSTKEFFTAVRSNVTDVWVIVDFAGRGDWKPRTAYLYTFVDKNFAQAGFFPGSRDDIVVYKKRALKKVEGFRPHRCLFYDIIVRYDT